MLKVKGGFRCVQGGVQAHHRCALVSAEAQLRAATICLPFTFTGLQQERLDGRTDTSLLPQHWYSSEAEGLNLIFRPAALVSSLSFSSSPPSSFQPCQVERIHDSNTFLLLLICRE